MTRNIIKRFVLLMAVLLATDGCTIAPIGPTPPQALLDSTVALVEDGRPFCAGTWIDQHRIVTAAHCVSHPIFGTEDEVSFAFQEDLPREFKAKATKTFVGHVAKVDTFNDVALLIVKDVPPHSFVRLARRESVIGEHVRVVGHPIGLTWTLLEGVSNGLRVVPGPDEKPKDVLQIVAPVFFGNSGGGAFNEEGELVGVCSFIMRAPNQSFFAPRAAVVLLLQ